MYHEILGKKKISLVQVFMHWNRIVFLVQTPLPIPRFEWSKTIDFDIIHCIKCYAHILHLLTDICIFLRRQASTFMVLCFFIGRSISGNKQYTLINMCGMCVNNHAKL